MLRRSRLTSLERGQYTASNERQDEADGEAGFVRVHVRYCVGVSQDDGCCAE